MEAERGDRVPRGDSDQGWTPPWQRSLTECGTGECRGPGGRGLALRIGVAGSMMARRCNPLTQVGKLRQGGAGVWVREGWVYAHVNCLCI